MSRRGWLIAILLGIIALFFALQPSQPPETKESREAKTCADTMNAYYISEKFVINRLKAPKTAESSGYREAKVTYLGSCRHRVSVYVDSQNGLGAMIRSTYVATVKAHPAVPGRSICSMKVPCAGDRRRVGGIWGGSGAIAERVSDELSGRDELRGVLV